MKLLKYNELTGELTDCNGNLIYNAGGGLIVPDWDIDKESLSTTDDMIKLKNAGFTAQDIIEIRKAGL